MDLQNHPGRPTLAHQPVGERGAGRHYPLMQLSEICALRVDLLAADDAHLWLGLGNYLRNQTEHLLFGVRGRAPIQFRSQGSWFYAPVQGHSHKPEEQFAIIERCSVGPYLELFARRRQSGWHAWGNEVLCDVAL